MQTDFSGKIIKAAMITAMIMCDGNDVVSNDSFDYIGDDDNDEGNKQQSFAPIKTKGRNGKNKDTRHIKNSKVFPYEKLRHI